MRTWIFFCTIFLLQIGATAQNEISVLHVSGQMQYFANQASKPVNLYPGMLLSIEGRVRGKGASTAKLVYEGMPIVVSGSKMRDLEEVVKTATQTSQMNFTGRFFNFLNESVKEGVTDEKLKKHHRRYMTKSSGGIKGWAKPGYAIRPLLTTTGKLPKANVIFKWRNTPGEGPYTFHLLNEQNAWVAQLIVRDTCITLDLDQLALDLDEAYSWSVERGESTKSVPLPFELCPTHPEDLELSHEPAYQAAGPAERAYMQLFWLEEERYFYSAYQAYHEMLAAEPHNPLLRRLYATFLARLDMLSEAEAFLDRSNKH